MKKLLTIVALSALALQGLVPAANAQAPKGCGETQATACFVKTSGQYSGPFEVTILAREPVPVKIRE